MQAPNFVALATEAKTDLVPIDHLYTTLGWRRLALLEEAERGPNGPAVLTSGEGACPPKGHSSHTEIVVL